METKGETPLKQSGPESITIGYMRAHMHEVVHICAHVYTPIISPALLHNENTRRIRKSGQQRREECLGVFFVVRNAGTICMLCNPRGSHDLNK